MKRLIAALVILVTALGISAAGYFLLKIACDELVIALDTVRENAIAQSDETENSADMLGKLWEEKSPVIHVLLNHDETKDAELNIAKIPIEAKNGEYTAVISLCEETINILLHIKSSAEPYIGNVLLIKSSSGILTGRLN